MTALFIAIYCFQKKHWSYGSVAFSCGLGIKMNLLLVLPGILAIMYQDLGPIGTFIELFWMLQIQVESCSSRVRGQMLTLGLGFGCSSILPC